MGMKFFFKSTDLGGEEGSGEGNYGSGKERGKWS